ncbi:MAG: IS66 family transposase [Tannerella sp.]|nr:IS66 family transposase [Tannerella sp.]
MSYLLYRKQCSCGHVTQGDYPAEAHSSICYGSGIQALTAYFHARQYIPYERMEELYRDLFGLSISSGILVSLTGKFSEKASGVYAAIHDRIHHSPVVGADETGTCIKGKNAWSWVFQTPEATFIHTDSSRGKTVIESLFPDGFPRTTLVHDCWKPYFGVRTGGHQICTAHLLRELKYPDKLYPQQEWTGNFTALLHRALELKKTLLPSHYLQPVEERRAMEGQLERLLVRDIDSKYEKLTVLRERMVRYRKYLFPFLYDWKIPPDNNASERAVRTFKVKLKVSGLFRSTDGANAFAVIRSVILTLPSRMLKMF